MTEQELVCPIMSKHMSYVDCLREKCMAWGYNVENRYCNEETEDCKKYEESNWDEVVCIGCKHAENIVGFCKLIEKRKK